MPSKTRQVIEERYIPEKKLIEYLDQQYGKKNYDATCRLGTWTIVGPRKLSEDELRKLEQ
ncbi:hypothetical protein LTR70_004721 [Exophiala xenobiotica]|uniref:Uncharacterized protein n=1 Tax=Lithohypha guttulata TaxID=1690604 RepID=A0ABR0KC64_9EURO|nr:hypothetical protein LTR24_004337 [Lithohypha guttulata]KAK5319935.1 hypothetical protein LTR70_004721 [Exophiala xenobiotica]